MGEGGRGGEGRAELLHSSIATPYIGNCHPHEENIDVNSQFCKLSGHVTKCIVLYIVMYPSYQGTISISPDPFSRVVDLGTRMIDLL